ncbi:hypothetical protein TWF569_002881 [Orbilia oligospora]|uniref:Rhodopsin domain-containing protein n=1 Tax=Orbilia oligospora TaxID=2813651 RepID=A0A7C8JQF0_ORBOL|nr:hypothetical protein TWF102_009354 [Orbilia oligospora]KAF3093868.1 hypothetical protein TWF103_010728 [Orbilia oligospora]KAF3120894.1 hypothetical protein TWF569_002881 [Orbilia oligospora]KAF3139496.1 hypothetical protein TWF703_003685 [Orbilia oligospora]KAF3141051.1 hypothetical protein TWF594_006093 [Orbilia oligospora]
MDRAYTLSEVAQWPKANYVNPEVYGTYLPPVEGLLLALSSTAVILRVVTRGVVTRSLGIDDIIIIPAWGFAIADSLSHFKTLKYGWGRHMWDIDWRNAQDILFWQWVNGWAFSFSVMFTKVSILCFYLRVASEKGFRWAIYIVLAFFLAWSLGLAIPMIFQCQPVQTTWQLLGQGTAKRSCIPYESFKHLNMAQGGLNLMSDIILFFLPLTTVIAMKRPMKERAALIGLFSLGLLVCIFAGLRLKALHKTFEGDHTWYGYELWLWVSLEVHIGIIIASLPGIRLSFIMLFRQVPLFTAHDQVESTLFSNPDLKLTANPLATSNGRYFDDNTTITTISAIDRSGSGSGAHGNGMLKHSPSLLQRLKLAGGGHRSNKSITDEKDFDFNSQIGRSRSATLQSTLGAGDDFEEIAVPPPTFGGFLVYKSTEITVTSEPAYGSHGNGRPGSPLAQDSPREKEFL